MGEEIESTIQTLAKRIKQERSERNNNNKSDILPSPRPRKRNELPSFSKIDKCEDYI